MVYTNAKPLSTIQDLHLHQTCANPSKIPPKHFSRNPDTLAQLHNSNMLSSPSSPAISASAPPPPPPPPLQQISIPLSLHTPHPVHATHTTSSQCTTPTYLLNTDCNPHAPPTPLNLQPLDTIPPVPNRDSPRLRHENPRRAQGAQRSLHRHRETVAQRYRYGVSGACAAGEEGGGVVGMD